LFAVLTCIFTQHDLRLVAVAALVCVVASSTAFGFQARGLKARGGLRWSWLALAGLVAGSGVWATHFLAMLAYQPTMQIGYDLTETAISFVVSVLGMCAGFSVPAVWREKGQDLPASLVGGALAGASIAVMHYIGIAAIRTQADVLWDMRYVATSILIAAAGGMAAFSVRERVKGAWAWAPPAGVFVLGIVGLHFTAMTAVTLLPDPTVTTTTDVMDRGGLALATSALAGFILLSGAGLMFMERFGRRNTFLSLGHALDAVPAALAFYDAADRLKVWNEPFTRLMATCGANVAAGDARHDLINAAAQAGWFAETEEGPEQWVADTEAHVRTAAADFHLPDGRWLRHEAFRTNDGGGVTVLTDITAQKESAAAMAAARDAAEAANRAKSEFLANMSHEIRTPLNGVLGIADVLTGTRLSAKQRELVGVIQQSGGLLNGLLTDLLDLARVEAGVAELRAEPASLDGLLGSVVDLFAGAASEKGLSLDAVLDVGGEPVVCDSQRLRQVLGNLLSNAIKFTDAGQVRLTAIRTGERVRFEVSDTGAGFDADQRKMLFQRFRQADNSATRKHGGAGLGLAICDEYVRLMGGELVCDSTLGKGSTFGFALDLPANAAPMSAELSGSDADSEGAGPTGAGFRVLVVDDNAVNRQVMGLILESAGIAHAFAEDGAEGVTAMTGGGFDAVLMDIQMPVMDGFEATRRIRAWERETGRQRAPILMVSANCLKEHIDAGRAAGADVHLNKPISAGELLFALEAEMAATRRAA
jgi:signal transduction histidine kinase/NO-binding membrane sensor protein with MHYT domain/ActR/RegA family two-component response regulator